MKYQVPRSGGPVSWGSLWGVRIGRYFYTGVGDDRYEDGWSGFRLLVSSENRLVCRSETEETLAPTEGSHQESYNLFEHQHPYD